jgi:hypothetical protein
VVAVNTKFGQLRALKKEQIMADIQRPPSTVAPVTHASETAHLSIFVMFLLITILLFTLANTAALVSIFVALRPMIVLISNSLKGTNDQIAQLGELEPTVSVGELEPTVSGLPAMSGDTVQVPTVPLARGISRISVNY